MDWNAVQAWWQMGGHGLYVWGAYGAVLAGVVIETWRARQRHQAALRAARQRGIRA